MKRIFKTVILASVFAIITSLPCSAFKFPKAFFSLQESLEAATNAGDDRGIIEFATKQYEMVASAPQDSDTNAVSAAKTYMIAEAYERLGDYENAVIWYERAITPNEAMGFEDAVKISKEKSRQFKTQISLYKRTYNMQHSHYAKNEHASGVLVGTVFDSPTRKELKNESMMMIYHNHGNDFNQFYEGFLREASEKKMAVEFAYNVSGAGDIGMINMSTQAVSDIADVLAKYPDVPVYLRFAGEVNAWQVKPNPEEFKSAFRKVADVMRSRCPNVAMVYGVNFVSGWDTGYSDYYPGDEYVDWVGVSLYCKKYYKGSPVTTFRESIDEVLFCGGNSAEPVIIMDKIVAEFGDRKPIMVFESGATGYTRSVGEYSEDWANRRIAKILNYLPMKYPQIKMIGYFDQYVAPENDNYSLKDHSAMKTYYNSQLQNSHFIQNRYDNDNVSGFENCDNGFSVSETVNRLSVYAGIYGSEYEKVDYFIDDTWVGASSKIPYSVDIDFSNYALGKHTLKYNVSDSYGKIHTRVVDFTVTENIKIKLDGNLLSGLDQPPEVIDSRTLVPVRAIFEAVGANVEWDGATQTVTATRDGDVVKMQIGDKKIYKNGTLYAESDVSPKTINGRTLVPARLAAEVFGKTVGWEQSTKTVVIS
ncbi:MAG: hypothetical protein KIG65_03175 [Eubacteriales bacterium]|nr:hypothetical protein [Eubacteriales bacterium]